jgi:hypothetical protein
VEEIWECEFLCTNQPLLRSRRRNDRNGKEREGRKGKGRKGKGKIIYIPRENLCFPRIT